MHNIIHFYAIRSHTLTHFEHVQIIIWPLRIIQRLLAYLERTRCVHNVPVTCISVCESMRIRSHTLM